MRTPQRQTMTSRPGRGRTTRGASGFTLVELLVSIAVIFLLLGLILTGIRIAGRNARGVQQQTTVVAMRNMVAKFEQDFGFAVPLVKDKFGLTATALPSNRDDWNPGPSILAINIGGVNYNRIAVWRTTDPNTVDGAFLRNDGAPAPAITDANPFFDRRFSEHSLPYYIMGLCNVRLNAPNNPSLPIDGVDGPGFFPPREDGTFRVPAKLLLPPSSRRSQISRVTPALMDVGRSDPKVFFDSGAPLRQEIVELRDRGNTSYRYYRWLAAPRPPANATEETRLLSLRVPALVGQVQSRAFGNVPDSRNLAVNAQLQSASWAIVGPGRDGVFGDEPIEYVASRGGYSVPAPDPQAEALLRYEAARDNIVEVGP